MIPALSIYVVHEDVRRIFPEAV